MSRKPVTEIQPVAADEDAQPLESVAVESEPATEPDSIFTQVRIEGNPPDFRMVSRVGEEHFAEGTEWTAQVAEPHRYLVRPLPNGQMVMRPDSFIGDDEIQ